MHNMLSYDFYKDTYLGSTIPESSFGEAVARAEAWLSKLERTCQVETCGPDSRAMALCAIAETIFLWKKRGQIAQTTVGGVTVCYEKRDSSLQRQLLQSARTFLDIHRGVD